MLKTFCLVLLIGLCASSDTSSLLHRLFGKRSKNSPPVILILDKNTLRPLVNQRDGHNNYDASEESETLEHLIQHLSKSQRSKSHGHVAHHPRSHQHSAHHSSRDRNLHEHEDRTKSQEKIDGNSIDELVAPKSVLRSPIYKSLLTLRNRLQCGARNECQDECGDKLRGTKKEKCENKCEQKFDCKEDKKEDDRDCGNSCEDSSEPPKNDCEQNQCQGSTKGILYEAEPVGCKRC